jgi:hypothetical protein
MPEGAMIRYFRSRGQFEGSEKREILCQALGCVIERRVSARLPMLFPRADRAKS